MKLHSIECLYKDTQKILISYNESKISLVTKEILDSILSKQVVIIFSHGDLNLTTLISSIHSLTQKRDVLIGSPRTDFNNRYKNFKKKFFSLVYKKKINNHYSKSIFFYEDVLLCNGVLDKKNEAFDKIKIETKPLFGDSNYRKKYKNFLEDKLKDPSFNPPKILSVPIDRALPTGILDRTFIYYGEDKTSLKNFSPSILILESINERSFYFDNLIELANNAVNLGLKVILHFSWPYLYNIEEFIEKINQKISSVYTIHLGKSLCLNIKNQVKKPDECSLEHSLEGKYWDYIYAPKESCFSNVSIFLPLLENYYKLKNLHEYTNVYWNLDTKIKDIRAQLVDYKPDNFSEHILRFPPFTDSILKPSDIKIRHFNQKEKSFYYIPITDFIENTISSDTNLADSFQKIANEIEKDLDIYNILCNLSSNFFVSKRTLFHLILIEEVTNFIRKEAGFKLKKPNKKEELRLYVARYFPSFDNFRAFKDEIISLSKALSSIISNFSSLRIVNSVKGEIKINLNSRAFSIMSNDNLDRKELRNFDLFLKSIDENLILDYSADGFGITISKEINSRYICGNCENDFVNPLINRTNFVFFKMFIKNGRVSDSVLLRSVKNTLNPSEGKVVIKCELSTKTETISRDIQIFVIDLDKINRIDNNLLNESKLILPGPLPFSRLSGSNIVLSQGFDSLLFPFKKLIFLAYPGYNLNIILKQISIYKELLEDTFSEVSLNDLKFSLNLTSKTKYINLPTIEDLELKEIKYKDQQDTPIDSILRDRFLNTQDESLVEAGEIATIIDLWSKVRAKPTEYRPSIQEYYSDRGEKVFEVEFDDGHIEKISFPKGKLIRKIEGTISVLCSIEEIVPDDELVIIQSETRESLDNFLLHHLSSKTDVSIEEVLEPFICLSIFCSILSRLTSSTSYENSSFNELYWLEEKERKALFSIIKGIMNNEKQEYFLSLSNNYLIKILNLDKLRVVFQNDRITYSKIYKIAKELGISIAESTFKTFCSSSLRNEKHYYFRNENDLLILGQLFNNQFIIENYQEINEMGKDIGSFLQMIGRTISRIISGKIDPLNELDILIEGRLKKCKVLAI